MNGLHGERARFSSRCITHKTLFVVLCFDVFIISIRSLNASVKEIKNIFHSDIKAPRPAEQNLNRVVLDTRLIIPSVDVFRYQA